MKNKRIIVLLIYIVVVSIISAALYFVYDKKDKTTENNFEKSSPSFSGIYQKDATVVYLYQDGDVVFFSMLDNLISGHISINDNMVNIVYSEENYLLSLNDNGIKIEGKNNINGLYQKIDNCTIEKYYEVAYGDSKYFDSEYNGYYENDDTVIYVYQTSIDRIAFQFVTSEKITYTIFNITDGEILFDNNFGIINGVESILKAHAIFNDSELTVTIDENTSKSSDYVYAGEYKRIRKLKYSDIVTNKVLNFVF